MLISWRPSRKIKVVIIGGGAIGDKIAQAVKTLGSNVQLVAVQCRKMAKAKQFAAKHRCTAYSNYEKMLDAEKPDLAIICTPSGAHMEPALAAINRSIHVLIEKPIEITRERVMAIIEAAEAKGVVARGIFQKRYSKSYLHLRDAIKSGRFGGQNQVEFGLIVPWRRPKSYFFSNKRCTKRNWKGTLELDGGGAVMNQGIHAIDQLADLMSMLIVNNPVGGQPLAAIHGASGGNLTPGVKNSVHPYIEAEDFLLCQIDGWPGCKASFLATTCLGPGFDQTLIVTGCDEKVVLSEDVPAEWTFKHSSEPYDADIQKLLSGAGSANSAALDPMAIGTDQHSDCVLDTIQAIEDRTPLFDLSCRQAGLSVMAVLSMYEAARTQNSVVVPELTA